MKRTNSVERETKHLSKKSKASPLQELVNMSLKSKFESNIVSILKKKPSPNRVTFNPIRALINAK